MERRIALREEDFKLVMEYLTTKPLPYKETSPVIEAMKRSILVNITLEEKVEQEEDEDKSPE